MPGLVAPWAALRRHAATVNLWPVLESLSSAPEVAGRDEWQAAGLPPRLLPLCGDESEGDWLLAHDPCWPTSLFGLPHGPVALSWQGNVDLFKAPAVAVVGARACTPYGRSSARRIAAAVAEAGGVVVSGLARGIDAEAHAAADGRTIAVLGQGVLAPMPDWQLDVRRRVLAAGGLVISEFPAHFPAGISTFPIRNRIIAGLARAVVVVEAAHRSGARNTAAHALRAGREVLAVPGILGAPASLGCLEMIAEGAQIVTGEGSVLEAAGLGAPRAGLTVRERRLSGGSYQMER